MAKILIVDDEQSILKMYGAALTGHDVITSENGDDAMLKVEKECPDLILLDIIMPKTNGLDVLEKLKEGKETAQIPVIMLTNLPEEASADKAHALGATDYFVKADFEPEKLAQKVDEMLKE